MQWTEKAALGTDLILLIAIIVIATFVTATRALRDGDVSWSGLVTMVAFGLLGWGIVSGHVLH